MKTRAVLAAVIAMTMIACDEDTTTPDSGTDIDSGTTPGPDSGPGTDSGPTPGTDGGTEDAGGTPGGGCEEYAQAFCEQLMTCDAEIFLGRYETMAICLEVVEDGCAGTGGTVIEDVLPLEDPDACTAAMATGCSAVFGAAGSLIEACVPPPGPRVEFDMCSNDFQCGMGERFDGVTVRMGCVGTAEQLACGEGTCRPMEPEGNNCTVGMTKCDYWLDLTCTHLYGDDADDTNDDGIDDDDDGFKCREVTYGESGDTCHSGTTMLCAAGLVCDDTNRQCTAVLGPDAACTTTRSFCDSSRGLFCQDDDPLDLSPDGHCTGPDYAPIGARCGTFDEGGEDVTRLCSAYAFCNDDSPTECEARDRVDEPCSVDPAPGAADSCWPQYECRESTCMPPEPPDDC